MNPARGALSAITLIVALLGTSTVSAFVVLAHPMCTAKQHDCGDGPKLTTCCCGDEQSSQTESTPGQSRLEVRADLSSTLAMSPVIAVATPPHVPFAIDASPPHRPALDLPTFFSSLLI